MNTKIKDTLAMKRFLNFLFNFWLLRRYFRILAGNIWHVNTRNQGWVGILIQNKNHVNLLCVKIGSIIKTQIKAEEKKARRFMATFTSRGL